MCTRLHGIVLIWDRFNQPVGIARFFVILDRSIYLCHGLVAYLAATAGPQSGRISVTPGKNGVFFIVKIVAFPP